VLLVLLEFGEEQRHRIEGRPLHDLSTCSLALASSFRTSSSIASFRPERILWGKERLTILIGLGKPEPITFTVVASPYGKPAAIVNAAHPVDGQLPRPIDV
jgi:hypothetical protein